MKFIFNKKNMTIVTTALDDDGHYEVTFPAKYEVCSRCNGHGVHDPEGFSDGFSSQDFDEDPEFAEAYWEGTYDVQCSVCHGEKVEAVIDEDRLSAKQREEFKDYERAAWEGELSRKEAADERKFFGC